MKSMLRSTPWMFVIALAVVAGCSESHAVGDPDATAGVDAGGVIPGMDGGGTVIDVDAGPGTMVDSGGIVVVDPDGGGTAVDGGSTTTIDGGPPGVTCGTMTCSDPQICCVTSAGGGMVTQACTAPADCMGGTVACDGPEDCATGEVCCGMRTATGGGSSCVPEADCRIRLCHADTDCGTGAMCCPVMGISICSSFGCFGAP